MGVFRKRVRLSNLGETVSREVEIYIDTGARLCQISQELTDALGLVPTGQVTVRYADDRVGTRPTTLMLVEVDGQLASPRTIIGGPGAPPILGANALSELGLGVDPVEERLIPQVVELLAQTGWPTI